MSLAEQIQRVDGGQNDTLKAILTALGVTVGAQKIDQLAALAATISPKLKPDNLNSAETNALYGLGADAVPDEVLSKIKKLIDGVASDIRSRKNIVLGTYNGTGEYGLDHQNSISFEEAPTIVAIYGYHRPNNPYYASMPINAREDVWIMDVTTWNTDEPTQYTGFGVGNSCGQRSPDGKTLYWATYNGGAREQYNEAGYIYHYFAIV